MVNNSPECFQDGVQQLPLFWQFNKCTTGIERAASYVAANSGLPSRTALLQSTLRSLVLVILNSYLQDLSDFLGRKKPK